jgi:hypothetical protein
VTDDIRFTIRPGEENLAVNTATDPLNPSGSVTLYGQTEFVVAPPGLPVAAGTKLYIEQRRQVTRRCEHCGKTGIMTWIDFRDSDLAVLSCLSCDSFLWAQKRTTAT